MSRQPTEERQGITTRVSFARLSPRALTFCGIAAEVALGALRLGFAQFAGPGVVLPAVVWPVMFYLVLAWQETPSAWRIAVRAAIPVVLVSWVLQAILYSMGQ